jgi:hypothetical protein
MSTIDDSQTNLEAWAEDHELEPTEAALSGRTPLLRAGLADTVSDAFAGDTWGRPLAVGELTIGSATLMDAFATDAEGMVLFTVMVTDADAIGWGRLTIHPVNVPEEDTFTRIFHHDDHKIRNIDEDFDRRFRVRVARAVPDEQVRELFDADFIAWCLDQEELLVEAEQSEEYGGSLLVAHSDADLSADQLDELSEQLVYLVERLGV